VKPEEALLRVAELPGFGTLQHLGTRLFLVALLVWLLIELYRAIHGQAYDFVTPVMRVGLGVLLLQSLDALGAGLLTASTSLASAVADESKTALFGQAMAHALGSMGEQSWLTSIQNLFSLKGWMAMGAFGLYSGMLLAKFLVIDILFPLVFGLVLVLGTLAVPLSVFPGLGSLGGWFRNLVEVALWPVVFQVLVALMVGAFGAALENASRVDFQAVFESARTLGETDAPESALLVAFRFWALCIAYTLLCLLTPLLAAKITRATPVSVLGGIVAAKAVALTMAGAQAIGGLAQGARGRLAGAWVPASGGMSSAQGGAQTALDRRSHRAPETEERS
jgi:hypothetical protein